MLLPIDQVSELLLYRRAWELEGLPVLTVDDRARIYGSSPNVVHQPQQPVQQQRLATIDGRLIDPNKPFLCVECPKRFGSLLVYYIHFLCSYTSKTALVNHMKQKHDSRAHRFPGARDKYTDMFERPGHLKRPLQLSAITVAHSRACKMDVEKNSLVLMDDITITSMHTTSTKKSWLRKLGDIRHSARVTTVRPWLVK
jgi:hypothetical protein